MNTELSTLISNIKTSTNIDIDVYAETGKFSVSTKQNSNIILCTKSDFEGIYQDLTLGRTYFKMNFKNAKLIGSIKGISEIENNYAYMITKLIENAENKDAHLSRNEYLKSILLGDSNVTKIQKFMTKFNIPDSPLFVLVIQPSQKPSEVLNFLNQYANNTLDSAVLMDDMNCAFVKFIDSEMECQSATDFANFIVQSLYEETGITSKIGVGGTVKHLLEANNSYQQSATAIRMCGVFNSKGEVHSYKEYLLIKMLEDIPKFKLNEYLEILLDDEAKNIFSDSEMINTAEEFLENSLNVSETSRNIYVHRNTLMYRLDKIERSTGLNVRKFSDAVTFRLITILYKLLK